MAGEGVKDLASRPADLVLVDLWMPGMSGWKWSRNCGRRLSFTPLIVVSGAGQPCWTAIQAMRLGAWDYVVKPFVQIRTGDRDAA